MKLFKEIYKLIKKYEYIVIARHIGADPDALGSQFSLKGVIEENFHNKHVYAVGSTASKFRFMGSLDKPDNLDLSKTLLIVLDTPDKKRIDGIENITEYGSVVKIDHHPFVEKYADIEYIEECSSASQLVFKFILENKLKMNKKIAENIYLGIVGDTDRFLHDYTTNETIELASNLLNMTNILEIFYVISYSALGSVFAYMYYKSNNIWINISFHAIHNSLALLLIFI